MATEVERKVVGSGDRGEVVIITKQVNVVTAAGVEHAKSYVVRQGAHTILETDSKARADSVAAALT